MQKLIASKIIIMFSIRIESAHLEQRDAILHFLLDHFRLEEPLSHSLHLTAFDAQKFFGDMVDRSLWNSPSFLALNDQNEIVGCRMNEIIDFQNTRKPSDTAHARHWPVSVVKLASFLDTLMGDLKELLPPETKKVMKFTAMSVHTDYQRRGIAKRLVDASIALAKEKQCDYVITGATAYRSQLLFENMHFQTLRVIEYKDYLDKTTGEPMFKCDDGTTCAKLMAMKVT